MSTHSGSVSSRLSLIGMTLFIPILPMLQGFSQVLPPIEVHSDPVLLVDYWAIDRMDRLSLRLHPPVRQEAVFTFDAPWEGPQTGYVTILRDGPEYRMYYAAGGDLTQENTALALSSDGIHWTRPDLELFEFQGNNKNNIVWSSGQRGYHECHNFTPFIDANPKARPEQRYKAVTLIHYDTDGDGERDQRVLVGFVSPDGIHWKRIQERPIIIGGGGYDSQNVAFWDPNLKRYVCYSRVGKNGLRSIQRSLSDDFLHWDAPEPLVFIPDQTEQYYTNAIQPYFRSPSLYLGFPMRFVPERKEVGYPPRPVDALSDAVMISSHDGLHFERTFREAFIRPGLNPDTWGGGHGNQTPAWGLIAHSSEEISLYWMEGADYVSQPGRPGILRRGTLRMDGFASVHAGYEAGELLTHPLVFQGSRLLLNVSTSAAGSVQVEVQTPDGAPVPGFELAQSKIIYGDEIQRPVTWEGKENVGELAGRPVRLRFVLKDADLYAFEFRDK